MKSILLIGDLRGLEVLTNSIARIDNIIIQQAEDEKSGLRTLADDDISLMVCNLSADGVITLDSLAKFTVRYPFIPCVVTLDPEKFDVAEVMKRGVSVCLCHPVNPEEVQSQVVKALEESSSGAIRGIPIHSLLQMLEGEGKTCTLRVRHKEETGLIYINKGIIVSAETGTLVGEDAVYTIVTWDKSEVEILHFNCQRRQAITKPLISLIMEAFRLKDERDSLQARQDFPAKSKLDLKHLSTAGNRISLDIGAKIKMEFNGLDTTLVSTMVGMIPDQYLIVTMPQPFSVVREAIQNESRIVVKYVHMGRLCMFKTVLLRAIDEPHQLLFLNYPPVIHFHELRRAKRTSIFVPCTVHMAQGPEYYGVMIDLSGLGCLCQIKARGNTNLPSFDIDTRIQLRCLLPGLKEDQELGGVVKNIKKTTSEVRLGIEFFGLQTYLRDVIEKYLYSVESITS